MHVRYFTELNPASFTAMLGNSGFKEGRNMGSNGTRDSALRVVRRTSWPSFNRCAPRAPEKDGGCRRERRARERALSLLALPCRIRPNPCRDVRASGLDAAERRPALRNWRGQPNGRLVAPRCDTRMHFHAAAAADKR